MKYILILIACFMLLCINLFDQKPDTTLKVSAGNDTTVTKGGTINFYGIYESNVDIDIINWFILNNTKMTSRVLLSQTSQLQYTAPDSACTLSFIFQVITINNVFEEDTVIAYVVPDTSLYVNAGQDQNVLVDLPVVLRAVYTGDNIINTFWKIGSNNFIHASLETTFTAPKTPLLLPCIFKITTDDNREATDTVNINIISIDTLFPVAIAGNDTSIIAGSQLTLHGTSKGSNITGIFWKIGNFDFTPAPLDTTITLPDTPAVIECILKVKNDKTEDLDTVKITVLPNIPLTVLVFNDTTIQAGSQLKIHGRYTGNVQKTFWKIGSSPFKQFPPETTITVPDTAMSLICILKVQDLSLNEAVDSAVVTVVDTNAVYANAGNDTSVIVSSSIKLSGSYEGNVFGTFWKIGASDFIPASPETTIIVPSTPLLLQCIFKVVGSKSISDEDTLDVKVIRSNTLEVSAGKDTIVPVSSTVKLNGSYTGLNIVGTFWNINNTGFITSSPDTTIQAPSLPTVWMCVLKVVTDDQKTVQDTMYLTTVPSSLQAYAGNDRNVTADSTVILKGTGKDTLNPNNAIVKYEWKYGDGLWIESADGTGIYNPSNIRGSIVCSLRVTAADGQSAADFCIINVISIIDMVLIPSKDKSFEMGTTNNSLSSTNPVHKVTFTKNFFMSKTEITQKEYVSLLKINPSPIKKDNLPVYNCNWFDAVYYCNARSKYEKLDTVYSYTSIQGTIGNGCHLENIKIDYTKKGYRLPTESEWEFACRAGTITNFYWGNYVNGRFLWYRDNSSSGPGPVGVKIPNSFGLYDMSGNVKEWCNDWYSGYSSENKVDPKGPEASPVFNRVVRNGSYKEVDKSSTSFRRSDLKPQELDITVGFRIVLEQ